MPVGGFNVGRDVSLVIMAPTGILSLGLITDFESKPTTTDVKILGIDGVVRQLVLPEGWMGTFTVQRQDSGLDLFWANIESAYYSGANLPFGMINETIQNPDGSISSFRYTQVALKYEDAGSWSGNKAVVQKLSFVASRRMSA